MTPPIPSAAHRVSGLVRPTVRPALVLTRPSGEASVHAARRRVALYSHDTMGLGHRRRSLLVAETLAASSSVPVTLAISGAADVGGPMAVPAGVDSLVLPALAKVGGRYQSRTLGLAVEDLVALRSLTIQAALSSFEPDLFIVDNVPRGAMGELDGALEALRANGRTRCVLGLRDVLDEPEVVRRQWRDARCEDAIRRHFDEVWVYGDRAVYDVVREYGLAPDVARKVRFTGYLDSRRRLVPGNAAAHLSREALAVSPSERFVLCLVGGGEDGGVLAEKFVRAPLPVGVSAVMVLGPFMPDAVRQRVRAAARAQPRLRVVDAVGEPTVLLQQADRVVMMGGYNTTYEVLAFERPALIVPRVTPRREQLIRAERLRDLGLVDVLHPGDLTAEALGVWLRRPVTAPRVHGVIDMGGLDRLPDLMNRLLRGGRPPRLTCLDGGRS